MALHRPGTGTASRNEAGWAYIDGKSDFYPTIFNRLAMQPKLFSDPYANLKSDRRRAPPLRGMLNYLENIPFCEFYPIAMGQMSGYSGNYFAAASEFASSFAWPEDTCDFAHLTLPH